MNESSFSNNPNNLNQPNMQAATQPQFASTRSEAEKRQEALSFAKQLFLQGPDWVTFFREISGLGGVARRLFPEKEQFLAFEQSAEYSEIQTMISALRNRKGSFADGHEPTRVITVRLPKSLHEALRAEAHDHKTSMNKLCISKLLQTLEEEEAAAKLAENANSQSPSTPSPGMQPPQSTSPFAARETEIRRQTSPIHQTQPISTPNQF